MGCCILGLISSFINALIQLISLLIKLAVGIILLFLKIVWKLLTLPFRLFRRSPEHKPPEAGK